MIQGDPGDENDFKGGRNDLVVLDDAADCQEHPPLLPNESLEAYRERIGVQ